VNLTADLYLVPKSRTELRITFMFYKKGILRYTAAKTFKTQKKNAVVRPQTYRFSWCGVALNKGKTCFVYGRREIRIVVSTIEL
jgi:hypothetical protein